MFQIRPRLDRIARGAAWTAWAGIFVVSALGAAEKPSLNFVAGGESNPGLGQEVRLTLQQMPPQLLARVERAGWKLLLGDSITSVVPELAGQRPSGWPGDLAWENADAVHLPAQRRIVIAAYRKNQQGQTVRTHRVASVVRHELGHAFDMVFAASSQKRRSDDPEFVQAYQADLAAMQPHQSRRLNYYADGDLRPRQARQEAFAEAFAILHGGGTEGGYREQFLLAFPRTMRLVRELVVQAAVP